MDEVIIEWRIVSNATDVNFAVQKSREVQATSVMLLFNVSFLTNIAGITAAVQDAKKRREQRNAFQNQPRSAGVDRGEAQFPGQAQEDQRDQAAAGGEVEPAHSVARVVRRHVDIISPMSVKSAGMRAE